jgi:hypothetical protein
VSARALRASFRIFLLMGATERHSGRRAPNPPTVARASARGGSKQAGEDAIVDAMSEQLRSMQQMNVPRMIVDDAMSVPLTVSSG